MITTIAPAALVKARIRGEGREVRELPVAATEICFHCKGSLRCSCITCCQPNFDPGECSVCIGTGRLAWKEKETSSNGAV